MKISYSRSRFHLVFCFFISFAIGAFLRLQQILSQVLEADEWHPVHQLIYYPPQHIASTLGHADYSIPIVLFYWLQMKLFGVSELMLRLPMIISGLSTIIVIPMILRNKLSNRLIVLFSFLLALSPFLISYSRIARPYAITLVGIYIAYWCFEESITTATKRINWIPATCYAFLCALIAWAHLITGPMLIAPLIALWWTTWKGKGTTWQSLIIWTILVATIMMMAVLPPIIADPKALTGKTGMDRITFETVYGASFLWFGTGSLIMIIINLFLAAIGWKTIWRSIPIIRWIFLGTLLTITALLIAKPWWVDRPLALARYLLPTVPILLLCVASGIVTVSDYLRKRTGNIGNNFLWTLGFSIPFLMGCWYTSPTPNILISPNSYTQHPYFQLNYRNSLNWVRIELNNLPYSPFWSCLSKSPPKSLKIAVMPFRYATYEWPSPIWERISRQRVIPAYLWGTCEPSRHGEIPPDSRFRFRNAIHMKQKDNLLSQGVDYLAYYRPFPRKGWSPPLPHCESWVRKHYGPPDYEEMELLVWRFRKDAPLPSISK